MPRFSIVLPCRNAEATLDETLASLVAQSFTDWEAICVDDGSDDATPAILGAAARRDSRIRVLRLQGAGPSTARNAGAIGAARGEILAFCDADDLWTSEKLARLDAVLADPGVDGVFGGVAFWDGQRMTGMRRSTVPAGDLTIRMLLAENPVCTLSNLAVRRGRFLDAGGFDPRLVHNEDLDLLIRLVGNGARIFGDPALHVLYRASPGGLSSDLAAMRASRRVALVTAARFGVWPRRRDEAIYARYLARRALRLDGGGLVPLAHALRGLCQHPLAFLFPLRRGGATALAALIAPALPRRLRRALFTA